MAGIVVCAIATHYPITNRPLAKVEISPPDAPNWRWEPEFKVSQNWGI
jgi:hypothetical protein